MLVMSASKRGGSVDLHTASEVIHGLFSTTLVLAQYIMTGCQPLPFFGSSCPLYSGEERCCSDARASSSDLSVLTSSERKPADSKNLLLEITKRICLQ